MKTQKHNTFLFTIKWLAVFFLGIAVFALTTAASAGSAVFSIPPLNSTMNAKYVNSIMASRIPTARKLLPLGRSGKFPLSVIPQGSGSGLNADTLDGLDSSAFALTSHNHFGTTWTGTGGLGLKVTNTSTSELTQGIWGEVSSPVGSSVGVFGVASATSGQVSGVFGMTSSPQGVGVRAWGAGAGDIALQVAGGGIQVPGADVGSNTPVFVHKTVGGIGGNIVDNYTIIDNSLTNGDPKAILIVTANLNPGDIYTGFDNHPTGVWYNGTNWTIYNLDNATMPVAAAFNVLVIKP